MDFFKEILNFSIVDVLDIFLVATLLYYAYKLLKGTVAIKGFMSVGIIALIVVFQPEIRKFLLMVGSANLSKKGSFFERIKFFKNQ